LMSAYSAVRAGGGRLHRSAGDNSPGRHAGRRSSRPDCRRIDRRWEAVGRGQSRDLPRTGAAARRRRPPSPVLRPVTSGHAEPKIRSPAGRAAADPGR
jgi:hypothetical protein